MYDRYSWYATPVPVDLSTSRSFPFHDPLPVQWILYIQLMTQRHTPTETHKQISSGLSKLPCKNDHRLMTGCKTSLTLSFLWLLSAKRHNSLTNCTSYQWIALHQRNLLYQVHHLLLWSILLAFYTIKQNNSQALLQYFTQLSTGIIPSTSLELCCALHGASLSYMQALLRIVSHAKTDKLRYIVFLSFTIRSVAPTAITIQSGEPGFIPEYV